MASFNSLGHKLGVRLGKIKFGLVVRHESIVTFLRRVLHRWGKGMGHGGAPPPSKKRSFVNKRMPYCQAIWAFCSVMIGRAGQGMRTEARHGLPGLLKVVREEIVGPR